MLTSDIEVPCIFFIMICSGKLTMTYIMAHCGCEYQDLVDALAKRAVLVALGELLAMTKMIDIDQLLLSLSLYYSHS